MVGVVTDDSEKPAVSTCGDARGYTLGCSFVLCEDRPPGARTEWRLSEHNQG